MPISDDPITTSTTAAPVPARPSTASATPASDDPFGFSGVQLTPGRMSVQPIRNQIGGEGYDALIAKMKKIITENQTNPKLEISLQILDRSVDPNLYYLGFIVTSQSKSSPRLGLGYNVVLLAATGEPLAPETRSFGNERAEVMRYPEMAADQVLDEMVRRHLTNVFGDTVPLYRSDVQVIPTSFNPEDNEAVLNLVSNAAAAATTSLLLFVENGRYFPRDLNLVAELRPNGSSRHGGDADLTFLTSTTNGVAFDTMNVPYRASVAISAATGYRSAQNSNRSLHDGSGPKTILETIGFIDLMPSRPRTIIPMMPGAFPGMLDQRRLSPVFVVESATSAFSNTPGALFLNFLVAASLNANAGWTRAFSRKVGGSGNKMVLDDIRAITIDFPDPMNPSKPTPKPPASELSISDQNMMAFLGTYCLPNLTVALDIPRAGPTTWRYSLFLAAAMNAPAAVERLNSAVNDLTNGAFLPLLEKTNPRLSPFASQALDIEIGYWETLDNNNKPTLRPISDCDYVAVANYADNTNNPDILEKWTNSFLQTNVDRALRLSQRRAIIREILGPSVTFTGQATRVFFNGHYLDLALKALGAGGVTTSSDTSTGYGFGPQRAHADFLGGIALPDGAAWAAAYGGPVNTGYGYMNNMYVGR